MPRCLQYHCQKVFTWIDRDRLISGVWRWQLNTTNWFTWGCKASCVDKFPFSIKSLFWPLRSCFQRDSSLTCPFCEFFISITRKLAPIIIDLLFIWPHPLNFLCFNFPQFPISTLQKMGYLGNPHPAGLLFSMGCLFLLYCVSYFVRSVCMQTMVFLLPANLCSFNLNHNETIG